MFWKREPLVSEMTFAGITATFDQPIPRSEARFLCLKAPGRLISSQANEIKWKPFRTVPHNKRVRVHLPNGQTDVGTYAHDIIGMCWSGENSFYHERTGGDKPVAWAELS